MKTIRIGNDIKIEWTIRLTNGTPYQLEGRALRLYLSTTLGKQEVLDFTTKGNILKWTFFGKDQRQTGVYTLTLVENQGGEGMVTVDVCEAFRLASRSCETGGNDNGTIRTEAITLSSSLDAGLEVTDKDAVRWTAAPTEELPDRKVIELKNGDMVTAYAPGNGASYNLGMLNRFGDMDYGSPHVHTNLNSKDRPTVQLPGQTGETAERMAFMNDLAGMVTSSHVRKLLPISRKDFTALKEKDESTLYLVYEDGTEQD